MHSPVGLAYEAGAELGEGPVWDAVRQRLVFVDIPRGDVHVFDPATGAARIVRATPPVSAVVCTQAGDWLIAAGRGIRRLDPDTGRETPLVEAEPESRATRMNDGAVDPQGRFWVGSMSTVRESGQGTLYRFDPDGSLHTMLTGVTTSNGIDWSPDGRLMYYVDTRTLRIDVFDFDGATGAIAGRRPFVDLAGETGRPDGLIVDGEGGVWVALWEGGAIRRYDARGRLDRTVTLPVTCPTKCAFGGPSLEDLFVTSASAPLDAETRRAQPWAGALLHLRPGVAGKPASLFAG